MIVFLVSCIVIFTFAAGRPSLVVTVPDMKLCCDRTLLVIKNARRQRIGFGIVFINFFSGANDDHNAFLHFQNRKLWLRKAENVELKGRTWLRATYSSLIFSRLIVQ